VNIVVVESVTEPSNRDVIGDLEGRRLIEEGQCFVVRLAASKAHAGKVVNELGLGAGKCSGFKYRAVFEGKRVDDVSNFGGKAEERGVELICCGPSLVLLRAYAVASSCAHLRSHSSAVRTVISDSSFSAVGQFMMLWSRRLGRVVR
jgi:hypothetical protein